MTAKGSLILLFVPVTLELKGGLRASFEYAKDEVMQVLSSLFSAAEREGQMSSYRCTRTRHLHVKEQKLMF